MTFRPWLSILALAALGTPDCAVAGEPTVAPPVRLEWSGRLRHEHVDDDAFVHAADAPTLRLRGALRFAWAGHWSALLEGDAIVADDGHYNSGANGRTAWPAVIDPPGAEINQAWLGWQGVHAKAVFGRQRLLLDNQRWIGNSGWRQNEQTFDALGIEWKAASGLTTRVHWLDRVHRIGGDDARDPLARERDLDTWLLNVALPRGDQQWVAYGYWHRDLDVAAASTATYGMRWTGNRVIDGRGWGWTLDVATQRDHGGNTTDFTHAYWLLEPTFTRARHHLARGLGAPRRRRPACAADPARDVARVQRLGRQIQPDACRRPRRSLSRRGRQVRPGPARGQVCVGAGLPRLPRRPRRRLRR